MSIDATNIDTMTMVRINDFGLPFHFSFIPASYKNISLEIFSMQVWDDIGAWLAKY